MKGEVVNCPTCKNSFIRKRKNHKFCRSACRQKNHRAKHGIEEPFKTTNSIDNVSSNVTSNVLGNVTPVKTHPTKTIITPTQKRVRTPDYEIMTLRVQANYWAKVHDDAIAGIFPVVTLGSSGLGYMISSSKKQSTLGDKIVGVLAGALIGNIIDEQRRDNIIKEARVNYDNIINTIRNLQDKSLVVQGLQQKGILSVPSLDGTMEIINSNDYKNANIPTLGIEGKWKYLFGDASPGFYKLVTGRPGNGKSTYCVEFAEYFNSNHGKVLYLASEQRGLNKSLQSLLKRFNTNFEISTKPKNNIKELSSVLKSYKMVVIDSVNHLGLTPNDIEEIRKSNPDLSIVAVMQSTKDGNYKGSQEYYHNCDIRVDMKNMIAEQDKSRFSPPSKISLIQEDSLLL